VADILIAGAGPAGWALAGACARLGLETVLTDPAPSAPWRATYGLWADEMPGLPREAVAAAPGRTVAAALTEHVVPRDYLIMDNRGLRETLADVRVEVLTGRVEHAVSGRSGTTVVLAGGRRIAAGAVVDASGARRVLSGGPPRRPCAEQTAVGMVLDVADAERVVPGAGDTALLMDWRRGWPGEDPTFLYSLPLGGGSVLVEETSLARRPGLGHDVLDARLRARFAAAGITPDGRVERVRIPLDAPLPRRSPIVPFGATGGLVHPATGYSLAGSLRLAPLVADALATGLGRSPAAAAEAARGVLWNPASRAVHTLRKRGLNALLGLSAAGLPEFFELFFGLPIERQRAFTSGRDDLPGTAAMMAELFGRSPAKLRRHLIH
jgi:lycopene beta-cyclase